MAGVEFVRDETGKLVSILIDGKKVKAGFVRGWRKAEKLPYFEIVPAGVEVNPFTGVQVGLNSLERTIVRFCMNWYKRYSYGYDSVIQVYDDMKYFLLDINSDAYYELLD